MAKLAQKRVLGGDAVGTLEYNGYKFLGAYTTNAVERPVMDSANRVVKYRQITVSVKAVVAESTSTSGGDDKATDDFISALKKRLLVAGAPLKYEGHGFGDFTVNTNAQDRDVNFGPIPGDFKWAPLGENLACEIEWSVTFHIPQCHTSSRPNLRYRGIREFTFDMSFDVDEHGDVTRSINGTLEIAMAVNPDKRTIPDSADNYWELIRIPRMPGFLRTTRRQINRAKTVLTFSIVDTQIKSENAYPPGCAEVSASHTVNWRTPGGKGGGDMFLHNSISVDITLMGGVAPLWGWIIFLHIARKRMNEAQKRGLHFMLTGLSVTEDIFTRRSSFKCDYRVLGCLRDIISDSGLFIPPGFSWTFYDQTADRFIGARGRANLSHDSQNDALIDMCRYGFSGMQRPIFHIGPGRANRLGLYTRQPPAGDSWVAFRHSLTEINNPQGGGESTVAGPGKKDPADGLGGGGIEGDPKQFEQASQNFIQSNKRYLYYRWQGVARRLGHKIPRPRLKTIGGLPAIEINERVKSNEPIGNYAGQTLYETQWIIDYKVHNKKDYSLEMFDNKVNSAWCINSDGKSESPGDKIQEPSGDPGQPEQ